MELTGKKFLVVGASGVLGAELTRQLQEKGATVLGTARVNDTAGNIPSKVEIRLLLDFENPESVKTLTDYLLASSEIDGIINASGLVAFGEASALDSETIGRLMAVNAAGPMQLFSALQPLLAKKDESVVVNLTGVVAETPLPGIAAYSASKCAIDGFLTGVTREWRRAGTRVVSARPGHTETGLAGRAIAGEAPNFPQGMTAEHVAARIVQAIESDEKELPASAF
jgi:short-subunit dehydrogenase|uniref:SDR family NAD(P)-dependent oxidoreductase n=1 Tax=Aquiluna sp. TaxID=2053504 RepID=UPI0040482F3B